MISPSKLTADQFSETFGAPMVRISPLATPPCDIWLYFDRIPEGDFEGHDCSEGAVDHVWENASGTFQHILVSSEDPDVYMVIVIEPASASVVGHRLLDLKREYGLEDPV